MKLVAPEPPSINQSLAANEEMAVNRCGSGDFPSLAPRIRRGASTRSSPARARRSSRRCAGSCPTAPNRSRAGGRSRGGRPGPYHGRRASRLFIRLVCSTRLCRASNSRDHIFLVLPLPPGGPFVHVAAPQVELPDDDSDHDDMEDEPRRQDDGYRRDRYRERRQGRGIDPMVFYGEPIPSQPVAAVSRALSLSTLPVGSDANPNASSARRW